MEDIEGVKTPINHAFFSMVALDDNDRPTPIPHLELETQEEREEWESATKRSEVRMLRREDGV